MKQPIGEFLATLRRAHGYTQQEIADKLDVSNKTISAWERGTVLPDILLLPALAELYGVTTDEILSGERKTEPAGGELKISVKSETKLLKLKLGKFEVRELILAGIFLLGVILLYIGIYIDSTTIAWVGWRWWLLLLYLGLAAVVISTAIIVALFFGALRSADDDAEKFPEFAILLYRKLSLFGYFAAGVAFLLAGISLSWSAVVMTPICAIFAVILFLVSFFMRDYALRKWNGEANAPRRRKNGRLYARAALWGLIPLATVIAVIIPFSIIFFEVDNVTVYSADKQTFTKHMESIEINGTEYCVPLSELKNTSVNGEKYDYIDGITYRFSDTYCSVIIGNHTYLAQLLTATDGFTVYNLRYIDLDTTPKQPQIAAYSYSKYELHTDGNNATFCYITQANFLPTASTCGVAVIVADIIVCFVICTVNREKTTIKL